MKPENVLSDLLEIASKLGIKIIQDRGNFKGGYCILEKKDIIVLNKLNPTEQKVKSLAKAFSEWDTTGIYMKPVIRDLIELYVK